MDPEEHQHDQAEPQPSTSHPEHDSDEARAADTIKEARTDEDQSWRQVSEDPEMWRQGGSTLAAWSPATDPDVLASETSWRRGEQTLSAWSRLTDPDATPQQFASAPEAERRHIEDFMGPERVAARLARNVARSTEATEVMSWGRDAPVRTMPHLAAGRSTVPQPLVSQHREACQHCGGTGYVPAISDYLRESAALLGDQGDEVVRTFYKRLFTMAPEVAKLFPGNPTQGDLGTDHRGAQQREKLLAAIVALSDLYDPDDGDKMARLDQALRSFGRSHAAFARPDGTVQGATWEEYGAVKEALFSTLVQVTQSAWKPEYTASWSQAYDYAAAVMIAEQHRSGFASPRFPRA